jgi:hypothetical protein
MGPNPFEGFRLYLSGVGFAAYAAYETGESLWWCVLSWIYPFIQLGGSNFVH